MRLAFDTNLMVYAEGMERVAADAAKCKLALALIEGAAEEAIVLPVQALAELHHVLVRRGGFSSKEAGDRIGLWADRAELVATDSAVFSAALDLVAARPMQIFDAIILAAAAEARCELLLSEDLHDGFTWRGVTVANPFGDAPDRRLRRLMAAR